MSGTPSRSTCAGSAELSAIRALVLLGLPALGSCADRDPADDGASTISSVSGESGDSSSGESATLGTSDSGPVANQVNVLFIIDNTGGMEAAQWSLMRSLGVFVDALGELDFRVAFTTTDNGNPSCSATEPESGAFVLSSCRSRLEEFEIPGGLVYPINPCLDHCARVAHDALSTGAAGYPTTNARPWVERVGGETNLSEDLDLVDALECLAPQGIRGCTFGQPLEAMHRALERSASANDDAFGFFAEGRNAVVIVTNAADCSYNPAADRIFSPDGTRVFWSAPEEQTSATPAVCWNAGVVCTGESEGVYEECHVADRHPDDGSVAPADLAALHPIERYTTDIGDDIRVYGLVGVPVGYPRTPLEYSAPPSPTPNDANFGTNHGVGPGCQFSGIEAVPPLRFLEVARASPSGVQPQSVCSGDYDDALRTIATDLVDAI